MLRLVRSDWERLDMAREGILMMMIYLWESIAMKMGQALRILRLQIVLIVIDDDILLVLILVMTPAFLLFFPIMLTNLVIGLLLLLTFHLTILMELIGLIQCVLFLLPKSKTVSFLFIHSL